MRRNGSLFKKALQLILIVFLSFLALFIIINLIFYSSGQDARKCEQFEVRAYVMNQVPARCIDYYERIKNGKK